MFRSAFKIFAYVVMALDILYVFTVDPRIALGRVIFLALVVWAWKLY